MEPSKRNVLIGAALAGLFGGALAARGLAGTDAPAADDANKRPVERCYGINACKGKGQCGGKGYSCAGLNACKGKGWIHVEKGHCLDIKNGSLTPKKS